MSRRPRRTIRAQLLLALGSITFLTLGVGALLSAALDFKLFRDHMLRDLQVLAEVVGESCVSALVFDSPETAARNLATLAREYQIRHAVLFDAEGREVARWSRPGAEPWAAAPQLDRETARGPTGLWDGRVSVLHPIDFDGRPAGRLVLDVRMDELRRQMVLYLLGGGLLGVVTLGVAMALALRLQRRIAGPVLALAERSRAISHAKGVGARIPDPDAGEELATLVASFNAVLAGIEDRELKLARHAKELDAANAKLRALATRIALVEEGERARLAAELHDSPMQKLALAQIQIATAARCRDAESEERLVAGLDLLREGLAELRSLQFELSPPVLRQRGLPAALEWLAASTQSRWGVRMSFETSGRIPELRSELAVILFQSARELVYNLIKHSGARRGTVRLSAGAEGLELAVEDDGVGMDSSRLAERDGWGTGFGLYSVGERLALLGGRLAIEPLSPGVRVRAVLPPEAVGAGPSGDHLRDADAAPLKPSPLPAREVQAP